MDFAARFTATKNFRNCSGESVRDCTGKSQVAGFESHGETFFFNGHSGLRLRWHEAAGVEFGSGQYREWQASGSVPNLVVGVNLTMPTVLFSLATARKRCSAVFTFNHLVIAKCQPGTLTPSSLALS